MRKGNQRKWAACLAAVILFTNMAGTSYSYGAPAAVEVDETMYVNLDYYGNKTKVNVVKGVNLNGNTKFTDYGTYEKVINMTSDVLPLIGDGKVDWELPVQNSRFYYQGTMKQDEVVLPWNFDISYQLNGAPVNADQLNGVSGLVEIRIQADPNPEAAPYCRNNMLLMTAVPVDLSKCYSVEAEGSQTQTMGETTAVVFTALPGESGDYRIRIGTDCFETTGVLMSMFPGTVSDLEHIKDLKEAKDTWKASGDLLYNSMEEMAKSIEAMEQGVNSVRSGINSAESARQTWSSSKDSILSGNDETLAALRAMSEQMETMVPHLQTAKEAAASLHDSMNQVSDTLEDMEDHLVKLHFRLKQVESDLNSLSVQMPEIQKTVLELVALDAALQANEQLIIGSMGTITTELSEAGDVYYEEELANDLTPADTEPVDEDAAEDAEINVPEPDDAEQIQVSMSRHNVPVTGAGQMNMQDLVEALQEKQGRLEQVAEQSSRLTETLVKFSDNGSDIAKYGKELTDDLTNLTDDVISMHCAVSEYYPELQEALDDAKTLVNRTTDTMNSGISTMTVLQNTLKESSGDLDAAARDSLRGSLQLLDQSLSVLDSTAAIRQAGRSMKDVMDNELDQFDSDNRFLFIDPSARKESFTSNENEEPKTIQIVLRTDEITVEDKEGSVQDAEIEKETVSPLTRMWNVLVKLWEAVISIFKER